MFVPKAPMPSAASFRNRRRQRADSDDSDKPPKAKRQRSALPHELSEKPGLSRELQHEHQEHSILGQEDASRSMTPSESGIQRKIAIRGPRNLEQQHDSDGTIILTKTDYYTVSQVSSLPDQFRGLQSEACRCYFGQRHNYVLALTHSHVVVWPYSSSTLSVSSDSYSVPIPEPCRDCSGPVPLGVLLSAATAGPPGLLVVIPSTGKIIYWETVSSAASLGVSKQRKSGILGSISGLFSGEYATDIISSEPSGVIVTLSSGRVAHISIRDSQGKPCVSANFLRNTAGSRGVGFFGGIRNALGGGSWRKDVAAVRTGPSHQRGQRDVIVATSTGVFEIWDTHWHNGSVFKRQFDIGPAIHSTLGQDRVDDTGLSGFRILDFVCSAGLRVSSTEESWPLLVLAATAHKSDSTEVSVFQVNLAGEKAVILTTHSVAVEDVTTERENLHPRIFLSRTGETAFIAVGQSIILLSLTPSEEPPVLQPLIDSRRRPVFQDSIHFRRGREYEILGYGFDDQHDERHYPSCLLMVRGFGVIRVTALPRETTGYVLDDTQVTAKNKLEQAVFYGSMLGNPLDLVSKNGLDFALEELEQAALEINGEILRSNSKFISNTTASLDQHLRLRAKALDDLMSLLLQHDKHLSRFAWWELLWGAEKLAAQRAMWKVEEGFRNQNVPTLLAHVIEQMSYKYRTKVDAPNGQEDHVRNWFIHDSYRMEHIIPWICNSVKPRKGFPSKRKQKLPEQILQAGELSLAVLETAFRHRDRYARLYASSEGILEDGVLSAGYEGLPEFWTSRSIGYVEIEHLLDFELDNCRAWIQQSALSSNEADVDVFEKIAQHSARHLRVLNQMYRERVHWLSSHEDPKIKDECLVLKRAYIRRRKWQLFKLAGIGQLENAIDLAETFGDMGALVELIIELQDQNKDQRLVHISPGDISEVVVNDTGQCAQKISLYFDRFGESWADAFFSRQISMGQPGALLAMRKFQTFITRFLHKFPAFSRLCWINDVAGENDYETAARSLENLTVQESNVWSHHVELSLAKLSKLAALEKTPSLDHSAVQSDVERLDNHAGTDAIQDMAYEYILPVLHNAVDEKAGIELAINHFGKSVAEDRPSLHEVLSDALVRIITRQVVGVDQLVDLLTLIDPVEDSENGDGVFPGQKFYLALRVVHLSCYFKKDPLYHAALQKLIWRRCMIRDNWETVGGTINEDGFDDDTNSSIKNTSLSYTLTACLKEGIDNLSSCKLFTPSEIRCSTSDLDLLVSRFASHQRSRVFQDLEKENEILGRYIDAGNLDTWFKNLSLSAQATANPSMEQ